MARNRAAFWVLGIVVLGFGLRVWELGKENLWLDEGYAVHYSQMSVGEIFRTSVTEEFHSPFHYLLLHFWGEAFGWSEVSVRFLSAALGTISIFLFYRLCRMLLGEEAGLLGAWILAISAIHVYYSQEARNYNLMICLGLLSLNYFVQVLQRGERRDLVLYVLATAFFVFTHPYSVFVVLAENLFALAVLLFFRESYRIGWMRWLVLQGVLAVCISPWIVMLFVQVHRANQEFWVTRPGAGALVSTVNYYIGFYTLRRGMAVGGLLLGAWWLYRVWKARESRERREWAAGVLVLLWFVTPIAVPWVLSQVLNPFYLPRYTLMASLGFYVLCAGGILALPRAWMRGAAAGVLTAVSLMNVYMIYQTREKEAWPEAAEYLAANAGGEDLVLFTSNESLRTVYRYYSRKELNCLGFPTDHWLVRGEDLGVLEEMTRPYGRVWLVYFHAAEIDPERLTEKGLSEWYREKQKASFFGIDIYRYAGRMGGYY